MPPYSVEQYLLDRVNIEDVVRTMYLLYDERRTSLLSKSVFADKIHVDYTTLLGGEPFTASGEEYQAMLEGILSGISRSQHAVIVLPQLPQPGAATPPNKAVAIGNAVVSMAMRSGPLIQDGGLLYVDLVRTDVKEGNPWRIEGLKLAIAWVTHGEDKVHEPFPPETV